jgi:hypothetical protein
MLWQQFPELLLVSPEVETTFQAKSLRKLSPFYLWERELLMLWEL